jgi:serine/threonine-protein kinase
VDTTLHDPLVGYTLDGRYRIEARIAVGGMATVYRAVDTRLDRVLALKVMHPSLAAEAGFVERFIGEAKAVARLDHPNIVSVYDQGADGTYVYLAMEYIAGCTLRDVLRERGALRPRAALDILEPMLAALGAAHRAGLVHRDMKPENVLIADDGRVKVVDFGLARAVDTNTTASTGGVLGTASYMAPEQIEHGTADPRSDVYACGLLLYEMLTGAKPYGGDTPMRVIYQRLSEDVPAPSAAVPGLAPELDALVADAAAREAARRPADAGELLVQLHAARQALSGGQLDAEPSSAVVPAASEEHTTVARHSAEPLNRTSRLWLPDPPEPTRPVAAPRGRGMYALIGALVLILGIAAGVWYISDGQFTRTPGVIGLSLADARKGLTRAGLKSEVRFAFSATVAKGDVISSDPARGRRIRDNDTVTLTVSKGPEQVKVPDVTGKPLAQARRALTAAGLTPGTVTRQFSDTVAAGQVVGTSPSAGTVRSPEAAVAITVSRGAPVDVPDVVDEPVADAQQKLQDAGLKVALSPQRVFSDTAAAGDVAAQSLPADSQAGQGDIVTLTLSKGQQMVEVPDVDGKEVGEAKQILQAAGFDVHVIQFFFTGTVTNQSPGAGQKAAKGSTITLWVG